MMDEEQRPMSQPSPAGERTPILVVDDEPYILRSLRYLLAREGYEVETASDGEEGLARVRETRPRLVFLDIMMPRMSG
jgi:two-component system alkaline phosphatase synthesis response regulator PhoP